MAALGCAEFYIASTPFGNLAAGILLAIGVANLWAFDSVRRAAPTWAREAVVAQVLALFLAGYVILIDWRSPEISRPVMATAAVAGIVALFWIVVLADRAKVKWTKAGAIIVALFPLTALLQFWLQTYYIPETSRPLVDISTELSPQGRTGAIIHLNAKVTVHNRGAALVNVAGALMRVTSFTLTPREALPSPQCKAADQDKEYCRIAAGLDLSGKNLDSDFRVNPAPVVDRQILYAGDFMNSPGTFLLPGATETFQREIDINPTKVRLARLSVSAVFVTERRIKDTRSCFDPHTSQFDNFNEFSREVNSPHDFSSQLDVPSDPVLRGHRFCMDYEIAPGNVFEELIGYHPVLRVFILINDPLDINNEYPQIKYLYGAANGFDKKDPGQREARKIEEANPTVAYLDVSTEYAPADPSPENSPDPKPPESK